MIEIFNQEIVVSSSHIVTLLAAFLGAFAAFGLERVQRVSEAVNRDVTAVARTVSALGEIFDVYYQYCEEILKPYREESDAWLNLSAMPVVSEKPVKMPVEGLSFLYRNDPGVVQLLLLEERRYSNALELIKRRNDLVLKELWPRLSAIGLPIGGAIDEADLRQHLGAGLVQELEKGVEGLFKIIDQNLFSVMETHEEFQKSVRSIYPKEKFVRISFPEVNLSAMSDHKSEK